MASSYQFFSAIKTPSGVRTNGVSSCQFGHKISNCSEERPQGVWAEWIWDGDRLTVRNDRFGVYPLFYYANSDEIMISNSPIQLIAEGAPPTYNEEALSVFCRCGFFLAEHTPFREIHPLPPNANLEWHDGHLSIRKEMKITKAQKLSTKEAVEGYIELFRKAMERYQPWTEEFVLPLTGGHDTRQILFELNRQGKLPKECVTCGEERDVVVAKMLVDRLNLNHHSLECERPSMEYVWRKNIATHFCTLEGDWLVGLGDYVAANFEESYDGFGVGEITRNYYSSPELRDFVEAGCFDDVAVWIFKRLGPPEDFFDLLHGDISFVAKGRDKAIELIAQELQRHSEAANPLASFNFWTRNRRALALSPFGIQSRVSRINTPFIDHDLFDFVSSFTPKLILENEPQNAAIKKAFPEYADIPFYNELPYSSKKRPFLKRLRNVFDRFLMITKYSPSNIPVMWRAQIWPKSNSLPLGYTTSPDDRIKILNTLFYLAQLSSCNSKARAKQMLSQYVNIYKQISTNRNWCFQ